MYQNCRLTIVRGNEVCRCQIAPRAISRRGGVVGDNLESDRNERSRGVGVVGTTAAGNAGSVGAGAPGFSGGTVISGPGTSTGGGAAAPGASTPGGNNGGGKGNNGGGKGNNGLGNGGEASQGENTGKCSDPSNPGNGGGNNNAGGGKGGKD
jgi:hypothetical protein